MRQLGADKQVITLLTLPEYAKHWGIKVETVEKLLKDGQFPVQLQIAGKRYFSPLEVPNFLTVVGYARKWNVSRPSIYNWIKKGRLRVSFVYKGRQFFDPYTPPPFERGRKETK